MTQTDIRTDRPTNRDASHLKIQQFDGNHPKKALVGLNRLNWIPFGANEWLIGSFQ